MPARRRARDLGDALAPALQAEPVPGNGAALVRYAGGRAALTRQLTGMDHAPRRAEYSTPEAHKAAQTKWQTAQRRVQRWDDEGKEGKQRRGAVKGPDLDRAQKTRLRRAANERKSRALQSRGLRARLKARVTIKSPGARGRSDTRLREMPQGGPGVYLDAETVRDIVEALREEGRETAAEDFLPAFLQSYGMPEEAEVTDVMWLKIWPDGSPEPAL